MPADPNNLSRFWQELKRRKVIRVITVYAAAAFVVLELVDIIAPNLGLPAWTFNFVLILLCVGFVISITLSWIYDIHPEGGIVKTVPPDKAEAEDFPRSSNSWRIASYTSFMVIIGLIVLNIIPRTGRKKVSGILDKSIAVLPFTNLSTDEENTYFIDGVMESILDNLCRIEDLRVPGRTSVMQYRENPKAISIVAEEMDVSYVLEGSGQKIGNRLLLSVQLLIGHEDRHIWSKQYDREIEKVEDLLDIQKEIAQLVAGEIEAIITPKEQELIEQIPTTDLTAYDFYQRGKDEYWNGNIDRAEELFHMALESDQAFAQAYNGLAQVYWNKHSIEEEEYLSESYLDSLLILTDIALSLNPDLSETHVIRGKYYAANSNQEQAIIEFDKALQLNPNDWEAYQGKANLYWTNDNLKSIENLHKAISLNRGPGLPDLLWNTSYTYSFWGFENQCMKYAQQRLELTGDSVGYYILIAGVVPSVEQIDMLLKAHRLDSTLYNFQLGQAYLFLGNYKESLKYFEKLNMESVRSTIGFHRIGLAYWHNGDKDLADYYFDKEIEISLAEIDLRRRWAERDFYSYYDLAAIYAIRGDKDRAIEYLRMFNQGEVHSLLIASFVHTDPSFENIRDEPGFQQIVSDIDAKYQAEHERIRQWLEANDML